MFEEEEELQTEPQVQCDSLGKRGKGVNVLVSLSLNKPVNHLNERKRLISGQLLTFLCSL